MMQTKTLAEIAAWRVPLDAYQIAEAMFGVVHATSEQARAACRLAEEAGWQFAGYDWNGYALLQPPQPQE